MQIKSILKKIQIIRLFVLRIKILFNLIKPRESFLLEKIKFNTFVDIGANVGIWSYYLQNNTKKILIFEPLFSCIKICKSLIKKKNTKFLNFALGKKNEKKTIYIPYDEDAKSTLINNNAECIKEKIIVRKGDFFLSKQKKIDLVKIDVEGYELHVLLGIKKTLKKNLPVLIIEIVKDFNKDYMQVYKYLSNLGYNIYYLKNQHIIKIKNFKKFINYNQTKKFFGDEKKNVYNFWFINKYNDVKFKKFFQNKI